MKDDPQDKSTIAGMNEPGGDDAALLGQLSSLPRAVRPENDPWDRIEQRILASNAEKKQTVPPKSRAWLAVAASFVLVAVSVVFVAQNSISVKPGSSPENQGLAPVNPAAASNQQANMLNERGAQVPTLSLEREYQAAFREFRSMEAIAEFRTVEMDSGLLLSWEEMEKVERALLMALEKNPGNRMLVQRLTKLRAHQLQFLLLIADSGQAPGSKLI